jgi:hypothetical protein
MPGHESPPRTPALPGLRNFSAAQSAPRARAVELALKAIGSNPREPCSSTPHPWRNLNPQESEEWAHARAHYEKMHPLHPTVPFGLVRMEQVKTDIGVERLCNQLFREWGLGQPTRAELRAERAQIRNEQPKLTPQQIDRNAYRYPAVRERCPRDMPKRRAPGLGRRKFCSAEEDHRGTDASDQERGESGANAALGGTAWVQKAISENTEFSCYKSFELLAPGTRAIAVLRRGNRTLAWSRASVRCHCARIYVP